jgi:sialate O-acetylesterase
MKNCLRVALILSSAAALWADVQLPAVISDHMLIQRDVPVRIWGRADAGEAVSVSFRGQSLSTAADALGRWFVFLAPAGAGGPFELTVEGKNKILVRDVLVGEVWIASGQSNMNWSVRQSDNAQQEIASAAYPNIRLFRVALKVSHYPLDDVRGEWAPCSPDSVPNFSGVGYYFARHLHRQLNIPVGVIQTAWGGTPAEAWTSVTSLAADPALISVFSDWGKVTENYADQIARYPIQVKQWEAAAAKAKAEGREPPRRPAPPNDPANHQWMPGGLYNAMIAPLTPYAIRGAIWYQGENNAGKKRAYVYRRLFPAMIQDWRRAWAIGDFPFLFVQLANFGKNAPDSQWPELREAQAMTLQLANTGMAVTIDIGNPNDIHPTNKQDVGLRLGLAARAVAYGEKIPYSGPVFRRAVREGASLRLWFDHAEAGLSAKGGELRGFEIAGRDGKFTAAQARIDGSSVVVSSPDLREPVSARYAWAESPECNLYNSAGLPASPFRTYEWEDARLHK